MYDIFISYSRADYVKEDLITPDPDKIVTKLLKVLDDNKITYWIDRDGIYSGDMFANVIAEAIKDSSLFLFVSTENSNNSIWTAGEIGTAREYKKTIIPFRADETSYHDSLIVYLSPLHHINYTQKGDKAFIELISHIEKLLGRTKEKEMEDLKNTIEQLREEIHILKNQLKDKSKNNDENQIKKLFKYIQNIAFQRNIIITLLLIVGLLTNIFTSLLYLYDIVENNKCILQYQYLFRDSLMIFASFINVVTIIQLLLNRLDILMCFFGFVVLSFASAQILKGDMSLGLLTSAICYGLITLPLLLRKNGKSGFELLNKGEIESKTLRICFYTLYGLMILCLCVFLFVLLLQTSSELFQ